MPVALASIAWWADDGTISFERTLPPLLQQGAGGTLGPGTVTGLAILLGVPDAIVVEAILQAARGTESERNVHEELARDCLLHARPWDRLDLGRLILSHAGSAAIQASRNLSASKRSSRSWRSFARAAGKAPTTSTRPPGLPIKARQGQMLTSPVAGSRHRMRSERSSISGPRWVRTASGTSCVGCVKPPRSAIAFLSWTRWRGSNSTRAGKRTALMPLWTHSHPGRVRPLNDGEDTNYRALSCRGFRLWRDG